MTALKPAAVGRHFCLCGLKIYDYNDNVVMNSLVILYFLQTDNVESNFIFFFF